MRPAVQKMAFRLSGYPLELMTSGATPSDQKEEKEFFPSAYLVQIPLYRWRLL